MGWLANLLGLACTLWALQQLRMTLVYMGVIYSPVVGAIGFSSSLVHVALRDAIKYIAFAIIFFAARWPMAITYLLAVLLGLAITDFIFAFLGIGVFGTIELTPEYQRRRAISNFIPVCYYAAATAVSLYFSGL